MLDILGGFLTIAGALAFFIYGMKMMSDGIQRAAGAQMRSILKSMTHNRFLGVFTGFLTTALVQSSSATTVMTVSFVNAGLLTLVESAGIMMGANIGTTITAWIISIFGLEISLSHYSIPLFAIGVPMLFSKRGNLKYWGEFVIGFSILFLGLSALKASVPNLENSSELLSWLEDFSKYGFLSRLTFVLIGAVITIIVQSSSAAMAVTLTLCYNGWLPLDVAASMVLGENIGTTITAELASLVGNTNAKRSARIHSMFNIIGVSWMIILMPTILPILSSYVEESIHLFEGYIKVDKADASQSEKLTTFTLSAFHTVFNLLNVLLLLPFVQYLVRVAKWSIKDDKKDDEVGRLKFIRSIARTPELALPELQKETEHFAEVVSRMSAFTNKLINSTISKEQNELVQRIKKYEKITDKMEIEIVEYITKLTNEENTVVTSKKLRNILNICNDLERIADTYNEICRTIQQKIENRTYFTPDQRNNINLMSQKIDEAFLMMKKNLKENERKVDIEPAENIENEINALKEQFKEENLQQVGSIDFNVNSALVYTNVYTLLERIGDLIFGISESIKGEI